MSNAKNVTTAKPKIGGAIYRAPIGTDLPEDASAELNEAFKSLGYVSDAGLKNNMSRDNQETKAWGGDVVDYSQTSFGDRFQFSLIEALNPEVLKSVYGDDHVSGTLETGISIEVNAEPQKEYSWVVDMVMKDKVLKRIVVPSAKVINVAEITYVDGSVVGYDTELGVSPDANGTYHMEYLKKGA